MRVPNETQVNEVHQAIIKEQFEQSAYLIDELECGLAQFLKVYLKYLRNLYQSSIVLDFFSKCVISYQEIKERNSN